MLGDIIQKAFIENNVSSSKTDTILNRLFTPHKPKSKIRMFLKAGKTKKEPEEAKVQTSFDLNKQPWVPAAQMQNFS